MQLGIHYANFTHPGGTEEMASTLATTAKVAEEIGCATFTLMDHWFQMDMWADAKEPMLEGYTSLGYLAGLTSRLSLSLMVTGVTYRHPGLLAKIVATLDVLTGGRAMLGIGAAWYEREHKGLGVPYPPDGERLARLDETLQICKQMWSDNDGPYTGTYYQLAETICNPRPIQVPGPPILIGGGGEKKTLRLVARHADACNLFAGDLDMVKHKFEVLEEHCKTEGRDPSTIRRTILGGGDPFGDPEGFVQAMAPYAALGVDLVEVIPLGEDPAAMVESLGAKVVSGLAGL